MRVKRLEAQEKPRRKKCKVRFSFIKKNKAFQKSYMKNLLMTGMVPARAWRAHAVEMAPTGRKLRRQMAVAAGKKETTSLSLFVEAFGLEVEEELSTLDGQENDTRNEKEAWLKQIFEVRTATANRGPDVKAFLRPIFASTLWKALRRMSSGKIGQAKMVSLFVEDWELARVALSCHIALDMLCQEVHEAW